MHIVREIKRGGFGKVEEVEHKGKRFARKVFSPSPIIAGDKEIVEKSRRRFVRETRIQKEINHPNIMPILWMDLDDNPPWFVMPLADHDYSSQILEDRIESEVDLEALLDILAGLEELHRLGYVHRDLKPQNILFLGGRWVLSDLGLVLPLARETTMLTSTHSAWGTPYYAAPELTSNFRAASPQADIFSFGCLLHDIVGDSSSRIPYSQVSSSGPLGPIIERCTAVDPANRFPDIATLRSALVIVLASPVPTGSTSQVRNWIELLNDDPAFIDQSAWLDIIRFIEANPDSDDAQALLGAIDIIQLDYLHTVDPLLFSRFIPQLCEWIRESAFAFAYCDVLAARLRKVYDLGSTREKAEAATAALVMGCSHNRWFVMRTFGNMVDHSISEDLADRLAIELIAMGRTALDHIAQLEGQIGFTRSSMHPKIQRALNELASRNK